MVNECDDEGWWIPGGSVNAGETFSKAAIRECLEEANVKVQLKGILRIDHSFTFKNECRMRVIYYAEPFNIKEANKFKFF